MLKREKLKRFPKKKTFSGIRYNARTISVSADGSKVSLSTIAGRYRFDLNIPKYFQKYGWSHAVQSVSRIPSEYNEYSPDLKTVVVNGNFRYAMAAEISKKKTEVYVTELKQIIESEKLLEDFFNLNLVGIEKGLSNAKREMQDMEEQGIVEFNHRFDDDLTCTTERMKLAIAQIDHLYQNNITKSE